MIIFLQLPVSSPYELLIRLPAFGWLASRFHKDYLKIVAVVIVHDDGNYSVFVEINQKSMSQDHGKLR